VHSAGRPVCRLYGELITSLIGGRPGMISGLPRACGGDVVRCVQHGVEYLFATVVLMGVLQIISGLAKFGKFNPHGAAPGDAGFCERPRHVIFLAQLSHFKGRGARRQDGVDEGAPLYTMLG